VQDQGLYIAHHLTLSNSTTTSTLQLVLSFDAQYVIFKLNTCKTL